MLWNIRALHFQYERVLSFFQKTYHPSNKRTIAKPSPTCLFHQIVWFFYKSCWYMVFYSISCAELSQNYWKLLFLAIFAYFWLFFLAKYAIKCIEISPGAYNYLYLIALCVYFTNLEEIWSSIAYYVPKRSKLPKIAVFCNFETNFCLKRRKCENWQ